MDHPEVYVAHGTEFLDRLIQEPGVNFVVWLVIFCLLDNFWIFDLQRKRPVQRLEVTTLLPRIAPGLEPDPELRLGRNILTLDSRPELNAGGDQPTWSSRCFTL
jgi:hypothetical protein